MGASASTSSRKISVGAASRARRKSSRTARSLSPTHFDNSSAPLTDNTFALPLPAIALTRYVLPQPGGPYSNTPRGGSMPSRANVSGYVKGHSTASVSTCFTSTMSPTSSSVTFASSNAEDAMLVGRTTSSAAVKSASSTVGVPTAAPSPAGTSPG